MAFKCEIRENPQKWGKLGIMRRAAGQSRGGRGERDGAGCGCVAGCGTTGQKVGGRDEKNVEGAVPYTLAGSFYVSKTRLSRL